MYVGMAAFRRVPRVLPHLGIAFAVLAAAAAANAAMVQTDLPCYLENRVVQLTGSAFTPGASYSVLRDGQVIGGGTVASDGTVTGTFSSGTLDAGVAERSFDLAVTDGTNEATTRFRVSRFVAEFAPARGDPATLKVRFSFFGFGRPLLPIYVHYLRPGGGVARTTRLGVTQGSCGSIPRTRMRRLFPFRPAAGQWRLQFDTHRSYARTARPRIVRVVDVRSSRRR